MRGVREEQEGARGVRGSETGGSPPPLWYFALLPIPRSYLSSGGSKGGCEGCVPPPSGPKFLHFHAVFGKNWPNNRLAPPPGLAPPPLGNPGSATVVHGRSTLEGYVTVTVYLQTKSSLSQSWNNYASVQST